MPAASVIIPTLGGAQRLPGLLTALATQNHDDLEVVVVCDGDIDGSARVAGAFADRVEVRVIAFPENRGRPAALNAGFAAARGEVLIRSDDDLGLPVDFVAHHVRLHSGRRIGVVGVCEDVFPDVPYARVYGLEADQAVQRHQLTCPPDRRWSLWSGNVSVTRDVFHAVGPYDESFREYGWEDVDWGYRLAQAGFGIEVTDHAKPLHYNPASSATMRAERAFAAGKSRQRFLAKHGSVIDSSPPGRDPWSLAVRAMSRIAGPRSTRRLGRLVDAAIGRVPAPVGKKLVALLVEGSAAAGNRHYAP